MRTRTLHLTLITVLTLSVIGFGCKGQKELANRVGEVEEKANNAQTRISNLETQFRRSQVEVGQLKSLVVKLGDAVVKMQQKDEERQRKALAKKKSKPKKKKKKRSKKKRKKRKR